MRGLYLHIPFCEHKCCYCDFYSVERLELLELFVAALCREIELLAEQLPEAVAEPIGTVYFGGGTPSLLAPQQMERIVTRVHRSFRLEPWAEWSIECNPGTVDPERLRAYRELGINRISFGVQSFQDEELRSLERIHTAREAIQAVEWAQQVGFINLNVDLMFAVPGQTLRSWRKTLQQALALAPKHISAYSLIWERGTPLYARWQRGEIAPVAEELDAAQYELAAEMLGSSGYVHYEVSNFARPGYACRHNLLYWHGAEYIALGPSAHGHLQGRRYWNVRNLRRYMESIARGSLPVAGSERIGPRERLEELIFLGLRADGIRFDRLRQEFDIELAVEAASLLEQWSEQGLVYLHTPDRLWLNWRGYAICNNLAGDLMLCAERAWELSRKSGSFALTPPVAE
ncbi:MAG: radical SAM family heme chaperone HemW [Candidatus Kapabacteria bacterium]|nr:radical SAM family heme chaperone HemW [Candidatus Kapabacteria bacterium]MCS7169597.1 radical SAM family heme chaperone HemW [Candidatus Kapabacteria bacterium]MDW7997462.1 radical SAM family heme chaperone HemW [Bacteroidota bacterium]MDW8225870.1 radical SAM family heme chaperone HemW [Bacteroidota bacterium]